jgi:hypothetical protein
MMNRKSWMKVVGCVAGALCMSQAWAASIGSTEDCLLLDAGDNSEASLLSAVQGLGFADAESVFKNGSPGLTVDGLNTTSGSYSYETPAGSHVLGYILKGGNNAIFCPTTDASGGWDTDNDFLKVGGGADPEGGINPPDLSYFAIVTRSQSVPEPASALAGLLALGLGVFGWNRMRQVS